MPRSSMHVPRGGPGPDGGIVLQRFTHREFSLPGAEPATAGNFGGCFFSPLDGTYELVAVRERHATAGNDAGAVTGMLKKVPSGTAAGSGTDMLSAGLSLKTTADTAQAGALSATAANLRLDVGDSAAFVLTGTPTALAGLHVETVWKRL